MGVVHSMGTEDFLHSDLLFKYLHWLLSLRLPSYNPTYSVETIQPCVIGNWGVVVFVMVSRSNS